MLDVNSGSKLGNQALEYYKGIYCGGIFLLLSYYYYRAITFGNNNQQAHQSVTCPSFGSLMSTSHLSSLDGPTLSTKLTLMSHEQNN